MLVKHIFSKICRHVQYIKRQYMVCVCVRACCVCMYVCVLHGNNMNFTVAGRF